MSKIGISAKENNWESPIDDRFGRAQFFLVFDEESEKEEWIENTIGGAHGVGPKVTQMLAQKGVNIVIAPQLGQNALQAMQAAGITAYRYEGNSLKEIYENYKSGSLEKITEAKK
ncbi:MAG: NifB/NifX family molybdenum-iron cluster-binding protein [Calditrichia bacterium]|nr:NifB/NifX family molybdenum-iron cluster-binding protein [Calditrichia bacterium]